MFPDGIYWYLPGAFVLIPVPFLLVFGIYFKQTTRWLQIADKPFLPWLQADSGKLKLTPRLLLLSAAWLMFCLALAGPRTVQWLPPALLQQNSIVRVLVDFSRSMQAIDRSQNRIAQVQQQLQEWAGTLPEQTQMGLSIFAGQSHTLLVPTGDQNLLSHFISQLSHFRPPINGNNLASALSGKADNNSQDKNNNASHTYLLIFSDGDLGETALEKALKGLARVKDNYANIVILGAGGDEAVTISQGLNHSLIHNGVVVVSRRHSENLQQLAQAAKGKYYPLEAVRELSLQELLHIPQPEIKAKDYNQVLWHEWFYIPLLLGSLLLLAALRFTGSASKLIVISLILLLTACHNNQTLDQQINNALQSKHYQKVLDLTQPDKRQLLSDYARFARGAACYRLKDYNCAQQVFSRLAWHLKDKILQAQAVFNLANSYFYLGDYEQAEVLYRDAARRGISADKTAVNIDFARSLAQAIRETIKDIEITQRRAEWRAASSRLTDKFTDKVADGIFLPSFEKLRNNPVFRQLSVQQQQKLLKQGIKFQLYKGTALSPDNENFWVLSRQDVSPESTAQLFNQLMAYETGLHYVPDKPLDSEGQRSW